MPQPGKYGKSDMSQEILWSRAAPGPGPGGHRIPTSRTPRYATGTSQSEFTPNTSYNFNFNREKIPQTITRRGPVDIKIIQRLLKDLRH